MAKYTAIGGQALIEGIMMKSPEKTAMAVRKPDKTIDISYLGEKSLREKYKILRIPLIRGIAAYIESMKIGYKAMLKSAEISGFADVEAEEDEKKMTEKQKNVFFGVITAVGTVLGVILAVALFMYLPRLAVGGLEKLADIKFSKIARSGIEQFIKLAVFILYMWIVSFEKDMKRVFMYHGSEHKTIFCYEKGLPLTVENVKKQSRFHPRCGTSFLILMIFVSIIFSTAVQMIFPGVYEIGLLWVVVKILLIPIICGAGFEILRICGKYDNVITKIISAPGLLMQRITTKEPEDDMIEIAIAALRACEPETPDVDRSIDNENSKEEI
ncbi:MAG: DUF1385 domain-containing protein [Clostridia bacterium]|nr:DUF1385 domain-containing protein [Clostridia bacterium]